MVPHIDVGFLLGYEPCPISDVVCEWLEVESEIFEAIKEVEDGEGEATGRKGTFLNGETIYGQSRLEMVACHARCSAE